MNLCIQTITSRFYPLLGSFNCEKDQFDTYLKFNTISDRDGGYGTTHILMNNESGEEKILGFYTLRNSSLIFNNGDNVKIGYPALEISQFAVDKEHIRHGYGTIMLQNIIAQAIEYNNVFSGIRFIVLCSLKDSIEFYKKFKFDEIQDGSIIPRDMTNIDCYPMFLRLKIDYSFKAVH